MMKVNLRIERINGLIQKELSYIIFKELGDSRIKNILINKVDTSDNLSNSKVFIICVVKNKTINIDNIINILNKASSFFRLKLSKKINLRKTPRLKFIFDCSAFNINKINILLNSYKTERN